MISGQLDRPGADLAVHGHALAECGRPLASAGWERPTGVARVALSNGSGNRPEAVSTLC